MVKFSAFRASKFLGRKRYKTPQGVLRAAHRLLRDIGWVKGRSVKITESGHLAGFCASGAIDRVPAAPSVRRQARQMVEGVTGWGDIIQFNDASYSTRGAVLAAFRKAAKLKK